MAQIKRDHSGWRSSGLWIKYQQPAIEEKVARSKSKKDTQRWCRGKKGIEHKKQRFFYYVRGWDYRKKTNLIYCKCTNCGKRFYGKHEDVPLAIEPEHDEADSFPVQVKVNGVALPIDARRFDQSAWYCRQCREWHY